MKSIVDITHLEREVNKIEQKIVKNRKTGETYLECKFKPNSKLERTIMERDIVLGNVILLEQEHYEEISFTPQQEEKSSEEVFEEDDKITQEWMDEKDKDTSKQQKTTRKSNETPHTSDVMSKSKQKEHRQTGFLGRFLGAKKNKSTASDSESYKRLYDHQHQHMLNATSTDSYSETQSFKPKHFINKTVTVSSLKRENFPSSLKFSKLIYLGDGCIGVMSKVHNLLMAVRLDGLCYEKKTFEGKISICGFGTSGIAIVRDPGNQIEKYRVSNENFTAAASVFSSELLSNITGFDFDIFTSNFALSTPEKVIVLDHEGNTVKMKTHNAAKDKRVDDIVTIFHFEKDCLYILNLSNKTLEKFSLKKKRAKWKSKIDHSDVPRSMCLSEDKLCLTCGSSIAVYSATSGEMIGEPRKTTDLLEDCLGICVIENVLVFSSGSDNFETSKKTSFSMHVMLNVKSADIETLSI